jgi:hypothetical protein
MGGKKMSMLNVLMGNRVLDDGYDMFKFAQLSDENQQLLRSITRRQRKKFIDKKIVPIPVLEILWDLDFLPGNRPPREGMRVSALLEFLNNGEYRDEKNRALGVLLRETIEKEECPEHDFGDETFIWDDKDETFIPVSYIRKQPGTIFR